MSLKKTFKLKSVFHVVNYVLSILKTYAHAEEAVVELFGIEVLTFVVFADKCDKSTVMSERNSGCYEL